MSALAYSSLIELISTNRAKETAQTMRVFAERALAEGKRQGKDVEIALSGNSITYKVEQKTTSEPLSGGYESSGGDPSSCEGRNSLKSFNAKVISQPRIGVSGISEEGYFIACGARGYCAAAVKVINKNSFVACIKRGNSANWEAL